MSKRFNISGPCIPERHYMLPPLARIPDAMDLVQEELYFVVHAPRQSGKTTSLRALRNELNLQGKFYAVYCSLESAAVGSDTHDVIMDITNRIWLQTRNLPAEKGQIGRASCRERVSVVV